MTTSSSPSPQLTPPSATPAPIDPRDITDASQIAAQLALLTRREADLTLALNALIADRTQVDGALSRLSQLTTDVDALSIEVDGVASGSASRPNGHPAQQQRISSRGLGLQNADVEYDDGTDGLVSRVNRVWETSERVGGKVRKLDEEIGRVREAADVVTEVLELKVRRCRRLVC